VVQFWEQALEIVWWRTQRKHKSRPTGDVDTERSRVQIQRLETALTKMTVKQIAHAVKPHLAQDAAANLDELAKERNVLAHRFLNRQMALETDGDFRPGTHDVLLDLMRRFMSSLRSVMATVDGFEPYKGPVPAHWPPIAERLVERAFSGQPLLGDDPRDR